MQQATLIVGQEEDRGAKINFSNGAQELADMIKYLQKQKNISKQTNNQTSPKPHHPKTTTPPPKKIPTKEKEIAKLPQPTKQHNTKQNKTNKKANQRTHKRLNPVKKKKTKKTTHQTKPGLLQNPSKLKPKQ